MAVGVGSGTRDAGWIEWGGVDIWVGKWIGVEGGMGGEVDGWVGGS